MDYRRGADPLPDYEENKRSHFNTSYTTPVGDLRGYAYPQREHYASEQRPHLIKQDRPDYDDTNRSNFNTSYTTPVGDRRGYAYPQREHYASEQRPHLITQGYHPAQYHAPRQNMAAYHPPQRPQYNLPPYQYRAGSNAVVSQPAPASSRVTTVPDHMNKAVFVTICCLWPLGIKAIAKAKEARDALARNDVAAALISSNQSSRYSNFGIGGGIAMWVILIIIIVVVVVVFILS